MFLHLRKHFQGLLNFGTLDRSDTAKPHQIKSDAARNKSQRTHAPCPRNLQTATLIQAHSIGYNQIYQATQFASAGHTAQSETRCTHSPFLFFTWRALPAILQLVGHRHGSFSRIRLAGTRQHGGALYSIRQTTRSSSRETGPSGRPQTPSPEQYC
jgi:hypothetical protein